MRTALYILLPCCLLFLFSCGKFNQKVQSGKTKVSFTTSRPQAEIGPFVTLAGGIMIYIVSEEDPLKRESIFLSDENDTTTAFGGNAEFNVPNGDFRIFAVGYSDNLDGSSILVYCADPTKDGPISLGGDEQVIDLELSQTSCTTDSFLGAFGDDSGGLQKVRFLNCVAGTQNSTDSTCTAAGSSDGTLFNNSTSSVLVTLKSFRLSNGDLTGALEIADGPKGCFTVSSTDCCSSFDGVTDFDDAGTASLKIPPGENGKSPFYLQMDFFTSVNDCSGTSNNKIVFERGIANGATINDTARTLTIVDGTGSNAGRTVLFLPDS